MVLPRTYQPGVGNLEFWPWPADSRVGPPLSHSVDGRPADQDQIFLSLLWLCSVPQHSTNVTPAPFGWSIYHIHKELTSCIYANRNHSLKFNLVNFHLCKQLIQWRQSQPVSSYSSYFPAASPPYCHKGSRVLSHFKSTSFHYYVRESYYVTEENTSCLEKLKAIMYRGLAFSARD